MPALTENWQSSSPGEVVKEITIERQTDAHRVNQIFNHPDVYPEVHGNAVGPLDLSGVVADQNNYVFCDGGAAVVFHRRLAGLYEMHTGIMPEFRGQMMRGAAHAFHTLFTTTDCLEILTHCPKGNVLAVAGARAVGMTPAWWVDRFYPIGDEMVESGVYSLMVQSWALHAWRGERIGQWFFREVRTELGRLGLKAIPPDKDRNANVMVGAALAMVYGGQPWKAVSVYNRWAILSGRKPLLIKARDPLVFDLGGVMFNLENDRLTVLLCQ